MRWEPLVYTGGEGLWETLFVVYHRFVDSISHSRGEMWQQFGRLETSSRKFHWAKVAGVAFAPWK